MGGIGPRGRTQVFGTGVQYPLFNYLANSQALSPFFFISEVYSFTWTFVEHYNVPSSRKRANVQLR